MNLDMSEGMFKKKVLDMAEGLIFDQRKVYENMRLELRLAQVSVENAYKEAEANQEIIRMLRDELFELRSALEKSDIALASQYRASVHNGESLINDALSLLPSLRRIDVLHGFSGIYFLVDGHQITYIGQSVNCASRIAQHVCEESKSFDSAYMLPCPKTRLNDFEAALIQLYQPRDNGKYKNGNAYCARLTRPIDAVLADIDSCVRLANCA